MKKTHKIGLFLQIGMIAFLLIIGQLQVQAAPVTHFGNFTIGSPQILDVHGIGYSGGTQGILEIFGLPQSTAPASVAVYLSKNSPTGNTGNYVVVLCAYPDKSLQNPCTNNIQKSWTGSIDSLPTSSTTPTFLNLDGLQMYPSIGYGLYIYSPTTLTNPYYFNATTNSGSYDGTFYTARTGCPAGQYWNQGFLCNDNGTLGSRDLVFDIIGGTGTVITLQVNQNGPEVGFSGFCVTPSLLPNGWTLNSNLVDLHIEDITSGTGTNILRSAQCDPTQGTYTSERTATLWNANYKVTATQTGNPTTFTAIANFTVTGSSVPNPTDFLTACQPFELTDSLSYSALKSSVGCSISYFAYNITNVAPFSWHRQVIAAMNTSGTSTIQIGVPIPAALANGWTEDTTHHEFDMLAPAIPMTTAVNVYDSSTNTGIANKVAARFPFLRTSAVMFLWLELAVWLAGMVWIFIPLL